MKKPRARFDPTPNPSAGKFTVNRILIEGRSGLSFASAADAAAHPVADRLFAIPGVEGVFIVADFVTVTKSTSASWADLEPQVRAAIQEAL